MAAAGDDRTPHVEHGDGAREDGLAFRVRPRDTVGDISVRGAFTGFEPDDVAGGDTAAGMAYSMVLRGRLLGRPTEGSGVERTDSGRARLVVLTSPG